MLDIKYVRENQEAVAEAMKNRNASWDAERFSSLDENRRAAIVKEEALQQERNAASKSIGEMMREGKKDEAETAKERVRAINEELDEVSAKREAIDAELHDLMLHVPNIPCAATPVARTRPRTPSAVAGAPRAISRQRASSPSPTGISALISISSISSAATKSPAADSPCSVAQVNASSARLSTTSSTRIPPAVSRNGGRPWS